MQTSHILAFIGFTGLSTLSAMSTSPSAEASRSCEHDRGHTSNKKHNRNIQLGPRPYYLVRDMDPSPLKTELLGCEENPVAPSDLSIGHRGAPLLFPEHTEESYRAAARMGAGIVECDVTFTADRELVCRHSQCDLHTTTNILAIPELAQKCSAPFTPYDEQTNTRATARCCTSDITLDEFKSLCGKMDASNPFATSVEEYMGGTAPWRTDLYVGQCAKLLTHSESIKLFRELGVKMTPELKTPSVPMPFEGDYTQEDYAQQMIEEYKALQVSPRDVFPQSFLLDDVLYWIDAEPQFGRQAVYLDDRASDSSIDPKDILTSLPELRSQGVRIVAPPMWTLLDLSLDGEIIPSDYAIAAKSAGLDIITWTLERDGPLKNGGGWYHQSITPVINNDGDTFHVLDALVRKVGVRGVFSDWPATTTYYANCIDANGSSHQHGKPKHRK